MSIVGSIALLGLGGAGVYYLVHHQKKQKAKSNFPKSIPFIGNVESTTINGALDFGNVVGWFKQLPNLNKEKHIPFIANASAPEFKGQIPFTKIKSHTIFLGVYDESNDTIIKAHLIQADDLDEKTKQVLGNECLVVLN